MKKKIFVYMLTLCLIVACSFALTACSNEEHHEEHHISIARNDYLNISTNVSTAKSEEKVTISYTKKENFVGKPGYELKFIVATNDNNKTIVVNYDESGNYYFIMPDCDVSISAEYLPIQYTITYDLNGGENNANNPTTYTVDSNDIIISQPTYTNYYFSGWTINDGSQIVRDYTIPSGTTGNITLKANWKLRVLNYDNYIHWRKPTYTGEEFSVNASDFIDAKHQNIDQFVEISGDTKATNASTYEVTLSLKDKVNYCWDDGTTEDKTATWEIVKAKLTVTRPSYIRYSGEEISVTSEDFTGSRLANLVDITGTTSATNVGTYNVTLSLKDKANTIWEDGTTEDKPATWEIEKRSIYITNEYNRKTTYSGEEFSAYDLVLYPDDVDFVNITGTVRATNAGIYEVTLSLKDKLNYCWKGGTTEDKTVQWSIVPAKVSVNLPDNKEYTYTGDEITITLADFADLENSNLFTISGTTSATNVGTYNVTLSLKENYCWSDGTTEDKTVQWSIVPAKVSINLPDNKEYTYTGDEITITPADFADLENSNLFTISGTTSATNVGTYSVILSLKENYCWYDDGTTEDKTVQWSIVPATVYFKTRATKNYTGDVITVVPASFVYQEKYSDLFTISGTLSATNAGTYDVTLALIDKVNYCWYDDGTTENKTVQWSIVPATVYFKTRATKNYTGDVITVTPDDFRAWYYSTPFTISGTTSATEPGTYNVTLALIDKVNYRWEDGTTEDKTVQWRIVLATVSLTSPAKEYTGDVITITTADFNQKYSDLFTISGTTSATEVGSYFVTISLKDKENTTWYNGNTNERTVRWDIVPVKVSVDLHIAKEYTGDKITITDADFADLENSNLFTVWTTSSVTKVGTYTATLSLKNRINYCWEDGNSDDITASWNIFKRVSVNLPDNKEYTGDAITVTPADFADLENSNLFTINGTTSATNVGTYEVTLTLKDKVNYCWKDGTTEDKTATWEIGKRSIHYLLDYKFGKYSGKELSVTSEYFTGSHLAELVDVTGTTNATYPGVYNVTLSLKDKVNYCWEDGTTEDKNATWEIQKRIIYLQSYKWETYSGEELSAYNVIVADSHAVDFVNITGTASATNVGVYEITLSLKDKENTIWEDGTTEDKNATWEIKTRKIATLDQFETIYTGDEIVLKNTYFIANINDSKFITLLGTTKATEVGTYDVILSLIDKANTTWEDGTTEDKTISWEIKTPSKVTLKNEKTEKVFTGSEISVTSKDFVKFSPIAVEITGTTSATNVGTYNVTLSLKDKANTTWEDGTTEDKNVTWEIVKAKLTVTRYTPLYSGEEKVVTSVNLIAEDDYADFVTVSGQTSATEPGAYTVTLSLNDKINMTWSDGTTDDKTVKWKIQRLDWKNNVAVSTFVKKIYTGEEITVTSADFILAEEYADYITISGQTSGTEKGTYTVTVSLADKENMTWADDTTEDKTVQWIIAD